MPTQGGRGLNGAIAAPMLQQSLIIVRRRGLERFLTGLLNAPWTDGEVSPEETTRRQLAPFELLRIPTVARGPSILGCRVSTPSTATSTSCNVSWS
jgi:hypothetical protein